MARCKQVPILPFSRACGGASRWERRQDEGKGERKRWYVNKKQDKRRGGGCVVQAGVFVTLSTGKLNRRLDGDKDNKKRITHRKKRTQEAVEVMSCRQAGVSFLPFFYGHVVARRAGGRELPRPCL